MSEGRVIVIDGRSIGGWDSFHDVSKDVFGFPDFYGRNMDAWIDCMTDLDRDTGMTSVPVATGQCLTIVIEHADEFRAQARDVFDALVDCSAFVNWRRIEVGAPVVIALAYWR